jgi:hypothetical protein
LDHAKKQVLFLENIGPLLSIDETPVSNGELYTVLINKEKHGGKGSIIALVSGTKSEEHRVFTGNPVLPVIRGFWMLTAKHSGSLTPKREKAPVPADRRLLLKNGSYLLSHLLAVPSA